MPPAPTKPTMVALRTFSSMRQNEYAQEVGHDLRHHPEAHLMEPVAAGRTDAVERQAGLMFSLTSANSLPCAPMV